MYYECCICKTSRKDATLHHFPCSENRLDKWLKCFKNNDDLKNISKIELSKLFVCQKHFEKRFITSKSHLLGTAYPSLFTEEEIASGVPSTDNFSENEDPAKEHCYSRKRRYDHTYCKREPLKEIFVAGSVEEQNLLEQPQNTLPGNDSAIVSSRLDKTDDNLPGTSKDNTASIASGSFKSRPVKGAHELKKRIVKNVKKLSPETQLIYKEYRKAKQQADFFRRAKNAQKFCKEHSFEELTKNMNPYAKKIMRMQIKLCTKSKKGRRFSTEEKLIALSIMKQSPKCYRFLHKIFILPSRSTLNKMVEKLNIETGICAQVTNLIKKEISTWNERKKLCSVIFDEMSLDCGITYDKKKDNITGFVELNEKKKQFADHALVFMLRGAVYKWQQPIAFYYCQGATSGVELKAILKEVMSAVVECGLKPIAVICDQGSSFQSALSCLKQDTRRDQLLANETPDGTVNISGVKLSIIYDPPHLIKGLRNNFLNKNISMGGKISKWDDIVEVYKTDCDHTETRLLHKLTDQHVIPEKIKKMKVKNCAKVLSHTVAAALNYTAKFSHYADGRPVSNTLKNTAETVLFFDQLFDSVNGAATMQSKGPKKVLRTAVTEKSAHHTFWREAIEKLKTIKYVDSAGKEKSVPSLKNFIVTLESYMRLWQLLKDQGIKIMRPRYFNSDPIENFFGQVRAYNYRHNDPSCHSFKCTFKSLLITRLIKFHNETFNCEDDPAEQVVNLQSLFENENDLLGQSKATTATETIVEQARRERINVHSRAYSAGWVVRKMGISCKDCKKSFTSEKSSTHDWISQKEYSQAKNRLNYPSEGAVRCFGAVITETNEYLEQNGHKNTISKKIKEAIMSKYPFDFIDCTAHKAELLDSFISITIRFSIMNWCNIINRILKGTDILRLEKRLMHLPAIQKMAYEKYKKKLKNKSFNK